MYKTKRKYQGEPIRTDPTCDPKENETAIHFSGGDRLAWVSSYEEAVVSGLLAHPDFKIIELVLMRIERKDSVVGVVGKIPVGALRIGNSRESNEHTLVIPPILKDKLFSPAIEEEPKSAQKTPARNGKNEKTQKREKAKLPLLTPKPSTKTKEKELSLSKSANGKTSDKKQTKRATKTAKKKRSDNQLLLIPLPISSNRTPKKIAKPTKTRAISSRKSTAPKLGQSKKNVQAKTMRKTKSRARPQKIARLR